MYHLQIIKEEKRLKYNNKTFLVKPAVLLLNKDMNFVEEVCEYFRVCLNKGQELNTVSSKGYDLKHFYNFLKLNKLDFFSIRAYHINDFIGYLYNEDDKLYLNATAKRSGATINRIISTIRGYYQYLNVFYSIDNPFENESTLINKPSRRQEGLLAHTRRGKATKSIFKVKEKTRDIKILTLDEYRTILKHLNLQRDKLLFKLLFFTGARIGEALSLKIKDIKTYNASKKVQIIELSKQVVDEDVRRRQKTGTRKLFVPSWLYIDLLEYYNGIWSEIWDKIEFEHDYFFIGQGARNTGNPLSYSTINTKFTDINNKIGINFTAHDLRHTYATNLARNKVDISTIQKLLGHKNPSTCGIYIELAKEQDIANELEKIYDKYSAECEV